MVHMLPFAANLRVNLLNQLAKGLAAFVDRCIHPIAKYRIQACQTIYSCARPRKFFFVQGYAAIGIVNWNQ